MQGYIFYTSEVNLPVELVFFMATASNLTTLLIRKTATDENNLGFDIERQPYTAQSWAKIGSVASAGTNNVPHSYLYTDNVETAGTYSYRLRQIGHNRAFTYSQAAQVTIALPKVLALSQNYPDPFNPSTTIQFTVPNDGRAAMLNDEAAAGVVHQVQFNASNLATEIYFSRLKFGGKVQIKKMLLLHTNVAPQSNMT